MSDALSNEPPTPFETRTALALALQELEAAQKRMEAIQARGYLRGSVSTFLMQAEFRATEARGWLLGAIGEVDGP